MVIKITKLAPGPVPKHLSARTHPKTIGEKKMAFLNANNPHAWADDEEPETALASTEAILGLLARQRSSSLSFYTQAQPLCDAEYFARRTNLLVQHPELIAFNAAQALRV